MAFGDLLDRAIAPFAPGWAASRVGSRAILAANLIAGDAVRKMDAGMRDRRTENWARQTNSIVGETGRYRMTVSAAGHDLVANNKYAAAGVRQLVAAAWGDGIQPQFDHKIKFIRERAQSEWNRFAESKVDGHGDWYGHGKICTREMFVGGESLTAWKPDDEGPDGFVVGMEGAHLDGRRSLRLPDGGKIVQGVEFAPTGLLVRYWLFDDHPNDPTGGAFKLLSRPVAARDVDHLFERTRHGQVRGFSIVGPIALTLQDVGEIEDAKRFQEKLQACIGLIVTPGENNGTSPLKLGDQSADPAGGLGSPLRETISPGMIVRGNPGDQISAFTPTPSMSTVEHVRQQVMAVSAGLAPYHLISGDTSKANYTSLRAAMNGWYSLVGDWQQNELIPFLSRPAAYRRLRRLALRTGDQRYLDCEISYALPRRSIVDPIKDLMGEILELRAGLKDMSRALAERGINADSHIKRLGQLNKMLDDAQLILDIDPRHATQSGVLQKLGAMAEDRSSLLDTGE